MTTRSTTASTLRNRAAGKGFTLKKSRAGYSGDNHGGYMITKDGVIQAGERFDMSPEDVDKFLNE